MKINKLIAGALSVLVMGGTLPAVQFAAPAMTSFAEEETLKFELWDYGDHYVVYGNENSVGDIVIPAEVNGVPITAIGMYAFNGCENRDKITSVTMSDSIVAIDECAFAGCKGLVSITLSENLKELAPDMFLSCSSLESITIPKSVTWVHARAFQGCESLKSITILNPDCRVEYMISNEPDEAALYSGIIRGYEGSTAQAYAEKYGYNFESLGETPGNFTYGDVTEDGKIDLNDAVAILQYSALPKKYPLSEKALLAADVLDNGTSGITGKDALVIMMIDAGLVKPDTLPLTSADI